MKNIIYLLIFLFFISCNANADNQPVHEDSQYLDGTYLNDTSVLQDTSSNFQPSPL